MVLCTHHTVLYYGTVLWYCTFLLVGLLATNRPSPRPGLAVAPELDWLIVFGVSPDVIFVPSSASCFGPRMAILLYLSMAIRAICGIL